MILLPFGVLSSKFPTPKPLHNPPGRVESSICCLGIACFYGGGQPPPLSPYFSYDVGGEPHHLNTTGWDVRRRIRSRIARNSSRGMATSAIWKVTYWKCLCLSP